MLLPGCGSNVKVIIPLSILIASAPVAAASFTIEQTGQSYFTLASAVDAIGDGIGTIRIAPGEYTECAVQTAGWITYRAEKPLTAIFEGVVCEGKAALVLRGRGAVVDGLVFEKFRVPDGNGAGIRIEKGSLNGSRSIFRDSEQGILGGGDDLSADIEIDRSTFSGLGRCDRGLACAHSIYLSAFRSVTVRRSRFERGRGGHYVKSRAARIAVADSSFDDSDGRGTNYMIDLPEGAVGSIERNIFLQGANKENHSAFIVVAAEGQRNSSAGLLIANNSADQIRAADWSSALLLDFSGSSKRVTGNRIGARISETNAIGGPTVMGAIKGWLRDFGKWLKGELVG